MFRLLRCRAWLLDALVRGAEVKTRPNNKTVSPTECLRRLIEGEVCWQEKIKPGSNYLRPVFQFDDGTLVAQLTVSRLLKSRQAVKVETETRYEVRLQYDDLCD